MRGTRCLYGLYYFNRVGQDCLVWLANIKLTANCTGTSGFLQTTLHSYVEGDREREKRKLLYTAYTNEVVKQNHRFRSQH